MDRWTEEGKRLTGEEDGQMDVGDRGAHEMPERREGERKERNPKKRQHIGGEAGHRAAGAGATCEQMGYRGIGGEGGGHGGRHSGREPWGLQVRGCWGWAR